MRAEKKYSTGAAGCARAQPRRVDVVIGLVHSGGRLLIGRRPAGIHLAGLWEFPGGKVEAGEPLQEALHRELREELGVRVRVASPLAPIRHRYRDRVVVLHPYICTVMSGRVRPNAALSLRWVPRERLGRYRFPAANRRLVRMLARRGG